MGPYRYRGVVINAGQAGRPPRYPDFRICFTSVIHPPYCMDDSYCGVERPMVVTKKKPDAKKPESKKPATKKPAAPKAAVKTTAKPISKTKK